MQLKKIAAGSLGLLMAGSTLAFAQLENLPQPFVGPSGVQSLIVVGSQGTDPAGLASDVIGAVDIGARWGGEVTTNVKVPGAGEPIVQGEGRALFTANEKIYLDNSLAKTGLRTSLSDSDLPNLLKSGTVSDSDASTDYDYDQFIDFTDDFNLTFNKISGDLPDPIYLFGELGTSASTSAYLFRSRVVFNDEVNTTTVVGEKVTLFGNRYTFASATSATATTPKVELFGGADTRSMSEGETVDVVIDSTTYTVKLTAVSSATQVAVTVGSELKTINKGSSATVGGLEVFVDEIAYSAKEGTISTAQLLLGARRLIITNNTQVKTKTGGESEKTVDGTLGVVTVSGGKLTGIDIYYVGQDSRKDFLQLGGKFAEPVWKTFSLDFPSVSTDVKATSRDKIELTPSGTKDLDLRFTNDRGDTGTIKWGHLNSSTQQNVFLQDDNADRIVVVEGAPIQRNQYFVVDSGDFSRIFELQSLSSLGTSDAKAIIRDVMSAKTIEVKFIDNTAAGGANTGASKVIDGQQYFFAIAVNNTDNPNLRVAWGGSAAYNNPGSFITVFPRLKTKSGAFLALGEEVSVGGLAYNVTQGIIVNNTKVQLPTGAINLAWDSLDAIDQNNLTLTAANNEKGESSALNGTVGTAAEGAVRFFRLGRTASGWGQYWIRNNGRENVTISMSRVVVEPTDGNATVLLVEEQDDNSNINTVLFTADSETRSSNEETSLLNPPLFSYREQKGDTGYSGATPDANSDLVQFVDFWGTYIELNTKDQNRAWAYYPDDQLSGNIFVLGKDAVVTSAGGAGTVKAAIPIKTPLGKLDREVTAADKSTKNLVLVGGPVVNSLVNELAAAGKTRDTAWYRAQGAGTALIDYVTDAFASGKVALVVAGHSAADTRIAAGWIQNFDGHAGDLKGSRVVLKNGVLSTSAA